MRGKLGRADLLVRLAAGVLVTTLGAVLLTFAGGLPHACPAVYPAPPSCYSNYRPGWIAAGSVVMAVLLALVIAGGLTAFRGQGRVGRVAAEVMRAAGAALGLAAIVFPILTAFSGGFAIGSDQLTLVAGAVLVCIGLMVAVARPLRDRGPADELTSTVAPPR